MVVPVTDQTTQLNLPPGFRFYPTDEELMVKYLLPKVAGDDLPLWIIGDVNLYKFDPWELPSKATFGEKEWYFFSPRDRKYPNGSRPNRVSGSGYWKATGTDKVITSKGRKVGIKKALVFYVGKAPKGSKTNWIMHEYRLSEPSKNNDSTRLDDWVLCRIYKKNSTAEKSISGEQSHGSPSSSSSRFDGELMNFPTNKSVQTFNSEDQKINIRKFDTGSYNWLSAGVFGLQDPINRTNRSNSSSIDPNFNMQMKFVGEDEAQNGISTSQRTGNSECLFSQRVVNGADPFGIRYSTHPGGSGYRQ